MKNIKIALVEDDPDWLDCIVSFLRSILSGGFDLHDQWDHAWPPVIDENVFENVMNLPPA